MRRLDQGPGQGHALLLAAGQLARAAVEQFVDMNQARCVLGLGTRLVLRQILEFQGKLDVVEDGHMGIEGIGLEDDSDVAVLGLDLVDGAAVEFQIAAGRRVDAGQHEQRRRFAASRRPQDGDELTVLDDQIRGFYRDDIVPGLGDTFEFDTGHGRPIPSHRRC